MTLCPVDHVTHFSNLQSSAFLLAIDLFGILFLALVTAMMNSFISLPSSLVLLQELPQNSPISSYFQLKIPPSFLHRVHGLLSNSFLIQPTFASTSHLFAHLFPQCATLLSFSMPCTCCSFFFEQHTRSLLVFLVNISSSFQIQPSITLLTPRSLRLRQIPHGFPQHHVLIVSLLILEGQSWVSCFCISQGLAQVLQKGC